MARSMRGRAVSDVHGYEAMADRKRHWFLMTAPGHERVFRHFKSNVHWTLFLRRQSFQEQAPDSANNIQRLLSECKDMLEFNAVRHMHTSNGIIAF